MSKPKTLTLEELEDITPMRLAEIFPISATYWFSKTGKSKLERLNRLLRIWVFNVYVEISENYDCKDILTEVVKVVPPDASNSYAEFFQKCTPSVPITEEVLKLFNFVRSGAELTELNNVYKDWLGKMDLNYTNTWPRKPVTTDEEEEWLSIIGYGIANGKLVKIYPDPPQDDLFTVKDSEIKKPEKRAQNKEYETAKKQAIEGPQDTPIVQEINLETQTPIDNKDHQKKSKIASANTGAKSKVSKTEQTDPSLVKILDTISSESEDREVKRALLDKIRSMKWNQSKKLEQINNDIGAIYKAEKEIDEKIKDQELARERLEKKKNMQTSVLKESCREEENLTFHLGEESTKALISILNPDLLKTEDFSVVDEIITTINNWAISIIFSSGLYDSSLLTRDTSRDPVSRIEKKLDNLTLVPNQISEKLEVVGKTADQIMDMIKNNALSRFQENIILRKDPTEPLESDTVVPSDIPTTSKAAQKSNDPSKNPDGTINITIGGEELRVKETSIIYKNYLKHLKGNM